MSVLQENIEDVLFNTHSANDILGILLFFKKYFTCASICYQWVLDPLRLELQVVVLPRGCWELNMSPLEEKLVLLTAELSLHPQ